MPPLHRLLAVDQQERDPSSLLHFYRRLLAWRKRRPVLVKGDVAMLAEHPQVLAFRRTLGNDALLCAFNFSDQPARYPLEGRWANAKPDTGSGLTGARLGDGELLLEPWAGAVLTPPARPAGRS